MSEIHERLAKLERGVVWCRRCGATQRVNVARALAHGWPVCCKETMTLDSPEERAAMKEAVLP